MGRRLLEREAELSVLGTAARAATGGSGTVVLVHGEAGIGKTSLVTALRARQPAEGRMLVGTCDALSTPRTLGPLRDVAGSMGPALAEALWTGDRERVLPALRDELASGAVTTLVVEDVHWADEATLDALRFVGRRIGELRVALVLTYRDDEVARDHPLGQLLGDLGRSDDVLRLPLERLSPRAVAELTADSALDPAAVWDLTDGNPYFVSELVASADDASVPPTVVDAVLGRLRRLPVGEQDAVETLAVVPSAVDRSLVEQLVPGGVRRLGAAEERGLLVIGPESVEFRHELTRRAVVDSLPAHRRIELNREALAALDRVGVTEAARLVHHAVEAGEASAVARLAPAAAAEAAASGAHRQAVAHYETALRRAELLPLDQQADLWERCAVERYTVGWGHEAVEAQARAVALRERLGSATDLGASLRWLSRMHWLAGDRPAAEEAGRAATRVLEQAGDPALLAFALSNQSQLAMLAFDAPTSITLARRAIGIARRAGDQRVLSHALNNLGTSRMCLGQDGTGELLEAARIALAVDDMEDTLRAYVNLVWQLLEGCRLDEAERHLVEAARLAAASEFLWSVDYLGAERARLELARGHWDEALRVGESLRTSHPQGRCVALTVVATVGVRRGDAAADDAVEEARALAEELGELQRTGPVAALRAEAALLHGDPSRAVAIARPAYDEAVRLGDRALVAELGCWLHRAGDEVGVAPDDHPFALQAAGRWREAAQAWDRAGCPYHRATALGESPDDDDLRTALALLDELGAVPLARQLRAELRRRGVRHVPRGPARRTRDNPAGLTGRQLEVLGLLAEGLTNHDIAGRLVLSVRTVDSHVAAVLAKLGVATRQQAARRARELGVADLGGRVPGSR